MSLLRPIHRYSRADLIWLVGPFKSNINIAIKMTQKQFTIYTRPLKKDLCRCSVLYNPCAKDRNICCYLLLATDIITNILQNEKKNNI
jgi:hypothetical protein